MLCPACGAENRQDARFCDACGSPLALTPPHEQRKVVTVLFCDVSGSTSLGERLDPEAVRLTMARYFDAARAAIERHGGTVEKFIGDAVMAVFGIPQSHEDDALRAVRAALELREAVALDVRIGINSGQVVTGAGDSLVTGDAVNVAARLEQAAAPGEILIGEDTHHLVRDAVDAELLPPIDARGKSSPLTAYRLVSVIADVPFARRFDAPLVGREREMRLLADTWERVRSEQTCLLFTVLGAPGVGKSRLSTEFLASAADARIVTGRCLSYGDGITLWPVVEVVKQLLAGAAPTDPVIAALLGDGVASVEETAYAVRRLVEEAATEQPVIILFDDVHWGEPAFLDLIEHLADWSRGARILVLCLARPELLDRRPAWSGGKLNTTTLLLESLAAHETEALIDGLTRSNGVAPELRERIMRAAEGNPLFVEEMLAMVVERGSEAVSVPPSIQALLAARIDGLPPSERSALERGSIEGQVFHRAAVQALAPDEPKPDRDLLGLVRKELVRPSPSVIPHDDAFRFRHLLIRDAAYESLPKVMRAELHERFASWLRERGQDLVELDEILGYHLEQTARYRTELGLDDRDSATLAAAHLGAAGLRAFERIDFHAAGNLLERAVSLLAEDDPTRIPLLATLAETVYGGGDLARSGELLAEAIDEAERVGDLGTVARARAFRAFSWGHNGRIPKVELRSQMDELAASLENSGDDENLARVLTTRGWLNFWIGEAAGGVKDGRRAIEHARRAGSAGLEAEAAGLVATSMRWGPAPWSELVRFIDERMVQGPTSLGGRIGSSLLDHRGAAESAVGQVEVARRQYAEFAQSLRDRGMGFFLHTLAMSSATVELRAGEYGQAERILRPAWEGLAAAGEAGYRTTVGAMLAGALVKLGRFDEAQAILDECDGIARADDTAGLAELRAVRALLASRQERHDEAIEQARGALAMIDSTDYADQRVETRLILGEALLRAGRREEGEVVVNEAIAGAEAKGSVVLTEAARRLLPKV